MTNTKTRSISGRAVVAVLAVLLAVGLTLNWYNEREQGQNTDSYVEQLGG